jgi:biopolymer transport protein ExbB
MKRVPLFLFLFAFAAQANAWWNDEWAARKQLTLDTSASGAETRAGLENVPVLVRLHTGNFDFLGAKVDGSDLRFIAEDDKTPLRFHIEKFDSSNELALVWVQVPKLQPGSNTQHVWLYSGNENAAAASDPQGTYDVSQTAVFHFAEPGGAAQDATGYANHAGAFAGARQASAIGDGLVFDGGGALGIPASPSLKLDGTGFAFSAWIKPAAAGQNAVLFAQRDGGSGIVVGLENGRVYAAVGGARSAPQAELAAGAWHHVALSIGQSATVYVNGNPAGELAAGVPEMGGAITVGEGFAGEMDELNLSNAARTEDWIRLAALGQGAEAKLVAYGEDESDGGGGEASYFGVILQSVTLDGWVVIVILMIMLAIAVMVMVSKAMVIDKTSKANQEFLEAFRKLRRGEADKLDAEDDPDEADLKDSALLTAMFGKHDHYQNSSLYRIYHAGIQELKHRFGDRAGGELSPQAIDVIKATLDGTTVRENQKLNSLMVLLTIAISGGPFLGLLGTVVGVMITFAAIAATGDVNVAAIAPGIAAALVATVAGLAVAIPALFGYNYLGSRIKSISADMHVFVDEFLAKIAETYSR